jgi:hypothetical protein
MHEVRPTKKRDDPVQTGKIIEVQLVSQVGDVPAPEGKRSGIPDASDEETKRVCRCVFVKERDISMHKLGELVVKKGLLSLLSVLSLAAQVDNGADFTTAFPFYAGSTKLSGRDCERY